MSEFDFEAGDSPPERDVYSVSRLNAEARQLLERGFARIWLEGELSNVARPASGHLYFTLKDATAQIGAVMFRNRNRLLKFKPEEGMQVVVRAQVSLYEARGNYQLIVEQMEEAGDGALRRAFEELKNRLAAEGLFDEALKKPLPALPARIGVITSPGGAAIRDVLTVLKRRFPAIPVLVYPVPVQGKQAATEIATAIDTASRRNECDVLILTRGGGSLEDLWSFNEEVVVRAIHACEIPLVSAIGHEIDFTIADFVADQRAPTPSAAAELVSPDQMEWRGQIQTLQQQLAQTIQLQIENWRNNLGWLNKQMKYLHPGQYLRQHLQRLDELEQRRNAAFRSRFSDLQSKAQTLHVQLQRVTPRHRIRELALTCDNLARQIRQFARSMLEKKQQVLAGACRTLNSISPLATLDRGYAIVSLLPKRIILHKATSSRPGDRVEARLASGVLECTVDKIIKPKN
jgi:exodeoxyribonuclease VII large subunit